MQIFKYQPTDMGEGAEFIVRMPAGDPPKCGFQQGVLSFWAHASDDLVERTFIILGTGHKIDIPEGIQFNFVDTIFDDPFVFHVFEKLVINVPDTNYLP